MVGQLRACEGDDVLPPRPRDHDGIHFTGPDGAERLLGRFQPVSHLPDSSLRPARGLAFLGHGGRGLLLVVTRSTSNPISTRSTFERSPMILRISGGSCRTSVGTTTMSSRRARCGLSRRSTTSML